MNLRELARHLNLSPTTVSRVLSGSAARYRISAQTVERVQEAAHRHQVSPDPLGSMLQRGRLGMVGLLVPDITNPFFSGLARAIELELREEGMTVQLCDSAEEAETETRLLEQMVQRRLDGLVIAPVGRPSPALHEAIRQASMPIVVLDRVLPDLKVPSISLDNVEAGRMAARHLMETGHRNIGCLRGDHESFTDRERFRGVQEALEAAGLSLPPAWVQGRGYTREAGREGATQLLKSTPRPEAVIALNGQGILGILEVAMELGLEIPKHLSVVAFDEQPWSAFVHPPLTTLQQPVVEMARLAARALIDRIQGKGTDAFQERLPALLRQRSSVAPPPPREE